jgi:hypothetical protein
VSGREDVVLSERTGDLGQRDRTTALLRREMRNWLGTSLLSFGLNIGCSNHFGPLLGFFDYDPSKSAGVIGNGVAPNSTSRALILGSASPALISLLSLSTISIGVFLGAPMPCQVLASSPATNSPRKGRFVGGAAQGQLSCNPSR